MFLSPNSAAGICSNSSNYSSSYDGFYLGFYSSTFVIRSSVVSSQQRKIMRTLITNFFQVPSFK